MIRKLGVLMLAITLLFAVAGCGKTGNNAAPAKTPEKVTVVLDWTPNTNHTGLYVAQAKGYYKAEGLDVEIVQPGEGGTAQLIATGKAPFGVSYQEEVTNAREQGLPIKAIAAVIQHNTSGFAFLKNSGIKNPKDFEGKAYGGWGAPQETAMIKALMDKYNGDSTKVKEINIGTADQITSLRKDIDFTWIYYGWTGIEAKQRGIDLGIIMLKDEEPALDYYTPVIITNEKTIKNNPELVKRFMRATSKGYEEAIAHPDAAAEILLKAAPELSKDLVMESQRYLSKQYQADASRWGEMKEGVWQAYGDWMYERKLIPKKFTAGTAFTNEFLPNEK